MRWIDIGKAKAESGGVEGITFGSEDGSVIVAPTWDAERERPDLGKWIVWDGKHVGRELIRGVTFKSASAAMRAAEVWRESVVVEVVVRAAGVAERAAGFLWQVAGAYAGRVVMGRDAAAYEGGAEPVVINSGVREVPRAEAPGVKSPRAKGRRGPQKVPAGRHL